MSLETALPVCLESALGGTGEASAFDSRRLAYNAGFFDENYWQEGLVDEGSAEVGIR